MGRNYELSSNGIDDWLGDYSSSLEKLSGSFAPANILSSILYRYVYTGRACTDFLKLLLDTSPDEVADATIGGGSDCDVLKRIKGKIGWRYKE